MMGSSLMNSISTLSLPAMKYESIASFSLSQLAKDVTKGTYILDIIQHPLQENLVVGADTAKKIAVVDLSSSRCIHTYAEHTDRISQLCFSGINEDEDLGNVFFSASEDGFIKIWDSRASGSVYSLRIFLSSYSCLETSTPMYCLDCNGRWLVSGSVKTAFAWYF